MPPPKPAGGSGHIRIIGGRWRGSKIPVPVLPGLRPTADRTRETLFNWLQADVAGARVLDLFAGTGALGLEAASRGAARVDFVERAPEAAAGLRAAIARLDPAGELPLAVHPTDAVGFLASSHGTWDLVFSDPPFASGIGGEALAALLPRLAARALVYVESPLAAASPPPPGWILHREARSREAHAALYRVGPA